MHHLVPRYCLASSENRFRPDEIQLEKQIGSADTVVICNPNNPTGNLIQKHVLSELCRRHPETRFVIDESYMPFITGARKESLISCGLRNIIVLHSLSKILRLPGLRIGFLIASAKTIAVFRSLMPPWSLNSLAQAAVHYVARNHKEIEVFIQHTQAYVREERQCYFDRLKENLDLTIYYSWASFFLIRLPEYFSASQVCRRFAQKHVLVRNCANFFGLDERYIRIALHQPEVNKAVAEMLVSL